MSERPARYSVLLICTANQCRSPMAEVLLKALVAERGETEQWQIQSAGTWAEPGHPATQLAQTVMQQHHLDLSEHRSRALNAEMLAAATIVFVMTRHQRESIQVEFPEISGKVYLLSQLLGREFDIEDPYGGTVDDYEVCAAGLLDILTRGYARLIEFTTQQVITRPAGSVQQV